METVWRLEPAAAPTSYGQVTDSGLGSFTRFPLQWTFFPEFTQIDQRI